MFTAIHALEALIGIIILMILPGFCWTLVMFANDSISRLERFVFSMGISIALETLTMFTLGKVFHLPFNVVTVLGVIALTTVVPLAWYYMRYRKNAR